MRKNLQFLAALIFAIITISCNKDNIYIVEEGGENKITSLIVVSDDYTAGIPAIRMKDTYSYSGGTFESDYVAGVASVEVKLNPSDASIDGVEWKIVRRAATTKATEFEDVFDGEITATRSTTAPESVTLKIGDGTDGFFVEEDHVYSVVAVYSEGVEVTSDVACLIEGYQFTISSVFMGDDAGRGYVTNYPLYANSTVVDVPQMYGVLEGSGTTLSFEQMGIGEDQYTITATSSSSSTLSVSTLVADTQWKVSVANSYADYDYNELNGYASITFTLKDSTPNVVEQLTCDFYTTMDDVADLTNSFSIQQEYSSVTFGVLSTSLSTDNLLGRLIYDGTTASFIYSYCDTANSANDIVYYIDGNVSTNPTLDYTTNTSNMQLTITESLSVGVHYIKICLSSEDYATTVTEVITFTVIQ